METITNPQKYHTHIESHSSVFHINLKELWQYKDLIGLFTKRSFVTRYKQTILGPAWLLLSPFITSVMYTLVFGQIAGLSTDGVPQILFYLGSTAIWTFFSSCLTQTAGTFTNNAAIFGKVYFPRLTMPISNVLSSAINFFISLLMFCLFWVYYIAIGGVHPNWVMLPFLLVILLQLGLLGLGFGIIISSLTTKYRDLSILITFGVQLWMYGTVCSSGCMERQLYIQSARSKILRFPCLFILILLHRPSKPLDLFFLEPVPSVFSGG